MTLASAVFTAPFRVAMTCSGFSAPKIAVPATMTLLPARRSKDPPENEKYRLTCLCAGIDCLRPHSTIDLDILVRKTATELSNLGHTAFQEFLAPAACEKYMILICFQLARKTNLDIRS